MRTLGEAIYANIENNEYLNELYQQVYLSYSKQLFNNRSDTLNSDINFSHVLRFADILSKSTHPTNSDRHKNIAQELVALSSKINANMNEIAYVMGSVLTNTNNYRGLSICAPSYYSADIITKLYEGYVRDYMKIPHSGNEYFFRSQKEIYMNLDKKYYSYSGPTSMGKSFVMRSFIKEHILDGRNENFAIVVPTKALINEVSSKIISDLKNELENKNYRIVTSAGALTLQKEHNFIFVLTPERLLYLLLERPSLKISYLFIDEAQKISSKDKRSPFYFKIVDMISRNKPETHIFFSSPSIPNPEVYLSLISEKQKSSGKTTSSYTPVSQFKYIINLITGKTFAFNNLSSDLIPLPESYSKKGISLPNLLNEIGDEKQNIIYCASTAKAVALANEYSKLIPDKNDVPEIEALIKDVKNEIHSEYYLAKVLKKGVAYHVGYLPSDFRMQIEQLYKSGIIRTMFCTSTLVEGVNLPADNLFITSYKNGRSEMTQVDFKNLVGRVGRIEYNLFGNVFLIIDDQNIVQEKFDKMLTQDVPEQKLSLITELKPQQMKLIVETLKSGNIELIKKTNQSADNYSLMRKFAVILLRDILENNQDSFVRKQFEELITPEIENLIKTNFASKSSLINDDINTSVDQTDNLVAAIKSGLVYPKTFDYNRDVMPFLNRISKIFKWDKYESDTIGNSAKLKWYAVILAQWMQGYGLSQIVNKAIEYKQENGGKVSVDYELVDYDDSTRHKNVVITDTLNAIEDIVLFRLANYFLKFSLQYKKMLGVDSLKNDWYEYVEYGTTNALTIFLQRNGFSRESSTYIKKHQSDYVFYKDGEYKISSKLFTCSNKGVCREAQEIKYNVPDLFF